MSQWLMVAVIFVAVALVLIVPGEFVSWRARREEAIKASMRRHPAGKDLDNGR